MHASFSLSRRPHPHPGSGERGHPRLPHLAGRSRRDDRHHRGQQPRVRRRGRPLVATTWAMAGAGRRCSHRRDYEPIAWLTKPSSAMVGQVLPTAVGDAVRIVEHAQAAGRRKPRPPSSWSSVGPWDAHRRRARARDRGGPLRGRPLRRVDRGAAVLGTILFSSSFSRRTGRHLVERVFPAGQAASPRAPGHEPLPGNARVPRPADACSSSCSA